MPIRKVADIKIRTSSKGRAVVTGSGTKFYSYDKDSAAIDFHFFNQDGGPTDLLNCEIKLMLLTKDSDTWKKFTIFDNDLEILSRIKGRARYIIPDSLRGYQGVVQGYVYLNFADGSRTDECYFTFTIERSKIEEEFENAGGYFIKEIQEVFDEVKEDLKNMRPQMETEIKDLKDGLVQVGTDIDDASSKIKDIQENADKYRGPKGDKGDASYTHVAWKMADGTFSTVYPGENLYVQKEMLPGQYIYQDGTFRSGGSNDAVSGQIKVSPGESVTIYYEIIDQAVTWQGQIRRAFYNDSDALVGTVEWDTNMSPKIRTVTVPQGATYLRISGRGFENNAALGKVEVGDVATLYTPSPKDDYSLAYPKYRGEYTDSIEDDSTDPNRYTWTAYLGERGPIGNRGNQGDSAYQIWLKEGNTGTESDFLNALKVGYTKDESDEKFVAKDNLLDIASGEEAIAGTAGNKLITPANMNSFYLAKTQKRRQRWDEGLNWIAHRGNNTTYPENSIPAFFAARRHWGIETDIQVTADGQWVVMHDETVDRTTNGTGAVASMTLAQFRALRIDTGANLSYLTDAEKTPPTFEEYLLICKQTNKVPVIEIKSYAYTETHYDLLKETLNRFGYDETNCVIISFDFTVLAKIRSMYPDMELHYLVNSITAENINQGITLGIPGAMSCSYSNASVTEANIKLIHAAGLKVAVWTVPDTSFDTMIKLGVDYITTNSQSGNLRFGKLALANGFTANASSWNMDTNYVEEISGNTVRLEINLSSGDNTQSTTIADLPSWAIPMYIQYANATIRTSGGISMVSMDVNGRRKTDKPGTITVGIGWSSRTTWVAGNVTYKLD